MARGELPEKYDTDGVPVGFERMIRQRLKAFLSDKSNRRLVVHHSRNSYTGLERIQASDTRSGSMTRDEADRQSAGEHVARLADRQKDAKIVTKDGEDVAYVLRNVLRESKPNVGSRGGRNHNAGTEARAEGPQTPVGEDNMHRLVIGLLNEWGSTSKRAPSASVRDHRYRNETPSEWEAARDMDLSFLTRYLGMTREQGHHDEKWTVKTAADTIKTSRDVDYIRAFLGQIAAFWTAVGVTMETLQPQAMNLFQETFDRHRRSNVLADWINHSWLFFMSIVLVSNRRVAPHFDASDPLHGWAASTPFGSYTGGDLFFIDLDLRVALKPGDLLVFRSALLRHSVLPFTGSRHSLVAFTHEHLMVHTGIPVKDRAPFLAATTGEDPTWPIRDLESLKDRRLWDSSERLRERKEANRREEARRQQERAAAIAAKQAWSGKEEATGRPDCASKKRKTQK
ncbi:hypothetical protein BMF94_0991 [Rhodotorula taiwanensis]|uniref:Fe2OG dioxygenase domain-containing protein n=1 Tax=Rhodotorula taiwanensis TaxID=741276 RepID=A0A2S5BGK2_9BASI|nr:hypothetical protein BMF94_0991 [Rhodotorula taiwanensis]